MLKFNNMKSIKTLFVFFFLIFGSIFASVVYAQNEFETEFVVNYEIEATGETNVIQHIGITNKTSDLLARKYALTIKQMNIYDVEGSDDQGDLDIEIEEQENSTTINADFNSQIVGEGRATNFQLQYKTKDAANKVGEVWNIHIPKVDTLELTKNYDIILKVPKSFGPEIFISPKPFFTETTDTHSIYTFNKENLKQGGITAAFGQYQVINYKLSYHLVNENNFTAQMEIALPPDIKNMQQVKIDKLTPEPFDIYTDTDGNTIALYKLQPNEDLKIETIGSVRISGRQIQPEFGGDFEDLPQLLVKEYTKEDTYWEVSSNQVQNLASKLKEQDKTVAENAQNIYNYITENLTYDFDITNKEYIERSGALKALTEQGAWACMEFTDLFIATARAMGIPARELDGFALARENNVTPLSINIKGGDLLHAWPEFYDPFYGWVAIDPTWGSTSETDYFTKLDTNHFAFVIKGTDSEYPLPAGTYKTAEDSKQVEVDFAQDSTETPFEESLFLYAAPDLNPINLLRGQKTFYIKNEGNISAFDIQNTGKKLVPGQTLKATIPRNSTTVEYETFTGETIEKDLVIKEGNPQKADFSKANLYFLVGAVLLLCMIFYVAINHLGVLKKLVGLQDHPPRNRGQ